MRSSLLVISILVAGCATNSQRPCRPMLSWSSPASTCDGAPIPPPVVAAPEPAPPPKRVQVTDNKIEISDIVQFETGKSVLLPKSEELLNEVAAAMKEHAEIKLVQIEGHTDTQGGTRSNMKLSESRAKAVRDYLVKQGIDGSRLTPKGFGETVPVSDNKTEEGRYKNRRVDFKILKHN
jgi:OOP family OmpA-OmpF porin